MERGMSGISITHWLILLMPVALVVFLVVPFSRRRNR
jgi:hypothetical protein